MGRSCQETHEDLTDLDVSLAEVRGRIGFLSGARRVDVKSEEKLRIEADPKY